MIMLRDGTHLKRDEGSTPHISINPLLESNTVSVSDILELYTLSEILDMNDITEEEVLAYLIEEKAFQLPPLPRTKQ
jgi:hypothetical protein